MSLRSGLLSTEGADGISDLNGRAMPIAEQQYAPVSRAGGRRPRIAVYGVASVLCVLYALFFSWLSLQRYDAFLMHALDMGNMDQAVWNTLHGHPFYFTNMRVPLPKEAWGTTTRLSFHVEPILFLVSLLYLIHAAPPTLIVAQACAVALGIPAAARLALRVTGNCWFAIAAAVSYALSPQVQAATLYEFHPVTLAAPLLMWTLVFAEERRYTLFLVFSVLAICCKEEIGLIVAAVCLWLWWRGAGTRLTAITALLSAAWSLAAVGLIVPHFAHGASAYWQRYINAGAQTGRTSSGLRGVLEYWAQHPEKPFLTMVWAPKLAMLHRWLVSTGYLGLFGLPLLLASIPSLAILLLSTDQHMYGGLAHYSAELVPLGVGAAVYGGGWLICRAARFGARQTVLVGSGCAAWLFILALSNAHANGFTPLAADYAAPPITAHDRLGQRLLALIPAGAPVSAMDQLNPHLGDRPDIYLFPDIGNAQYVALDLTTNVNPGTPLQIAQTTSRLLASRRWQILAAEDGYLLLHRVSRVLALPPRLPASFFTFGLPGAVKGGDLARFGDALALVSVQVERREQVNLRVPDVLLVTRWRVLRPLPAGLRIEFQVTHTRRRTVDRFDDQMLLDWLPPNQWPVGSIVQVQSSQLSIVDVDPGTVQLRIAVRRGSASGQDRYFPPRLMGDEQVGTLAVVGSSLAVASVPLVF